MLEVREVKRVAVVVVGTPPGRSGTRKWRRGTWSGILVERRDRGEEIGDDWFTFLKFERKSRFELDFRILERKTMRLKVEDGTIVGCGPA